ncbi:hypothetical protein ANOM_008096 [Aspergillus nomiae NRRL 13137]|uniref:Uncharacterized protein n=1 Tax=Aspergillus nomiae NRRL (strain ATCC 15546 / NRRL 13137 / CBS 260.88 / M93) TaxID=1509407 RepID=A0A0L1J0A4_ASPN3|nr:uncharacterized protein ANOM_008096 [Aspergillus nomiae NRRL 13137]KNG85199.1 hypothetical protein ANOM_008096 [Aspergillus nomiae NRRL 13137]
MALSIDDLGKNGICDAIHQAWAKRNILFMFIDQRGLFNIRDKLPPTASSLDSPPGERAILPVIPREVFGVANKLGVQGRFVNNTLYPVGEIANLLKVRRPFRRRPIR